MIRMLGFLTGSALTIGAVLLVIGLPELGETPSDEQQPAVTAAPSALPDQAVTVADAQPPALPDAADSSAPAATVKTTPLPADAGMPPNPIAPSDSPHWHSFWNPFRSEIAANGFATRLRSVTGIDYRVVRLEPGSYQVAFAYGDESERRTKIAQIETATGLELPEESR